MDFLLFETKMKANGIVDIKPDFNLKKHKDLMIRSGDFYAVWDPEKGLWSTDESRVIDMVDEALYQYDKDYRAKYPGQTNLSLMVKSSSGMINRWHDYCKKQLRDSFTILDQNILFKNSKVTKEDYASKTLDYPLEEGSTEAYDRLMSVLYSPEERHKIEWAIGSIVTGDSKVNQKFLVLYGSAGTGKSTILNIIQMLFDGYYAVFDAKALGDSKDQFSLEPFMNHPLVGIQHDGDLSKIEDNTKLNSLVSHEMQVVNPKGHSRYSARFYTFLFMGTNNPVKITNAKSGILRRLIDVSPTGEKVPYSEYSQLMSQIKFELGAIAYHCKQVYLENPNYYDNYVATTMLGATNDFYNFVEYYYYIFKEADETSLKQAYEMYKTYCTDARVLWPFSRRVFKEELKNYFDNYYPDYHDESGTHITNYYTGFKHEKFETIINSEPAESSGWIKFRKIPSLFDSQCKGYPAQYANDVGIPTKKWAEVTTKLQDINTSKLHYVRVPINHIVIDFDIKDEDGNKSYEKNLAEANKWPKTYAELSKSGAGIHLHYIYEGDVTKLASLYSKDIEIKVFSGNSALRRKLTKCNDIQIATLNSGLPTRGEEAKTMATPTSIQDEKELRRRIVNTVNKRYDALQHTKPCIDFIYKLLEDAYNSGMPYDLTNMQDDIFNFAAQSTNNSSYCKKLVLQMKFKSEEESKLPEEVADKPITFYDVEVFPNLFLVNYKIHKKKKMYRLINPTSNDIEQLVNNHRLVGFNNRRYDNHMLYATLMGYTNEQLYKLSQKIIAGDKNAFFGEAYNLSYTDIYDFSSKKQSLKKWEIELDIHHQELGMPWDQPVPEDQWYKVSEYCDNDVIATEAVWEACEGDFMARQILAALAGMSVNDTTNSLTQRIIFGKDKNPQSEFTYRNLAEPVAPSPEIFRQYGEKRIYRVFDKEGNPTYEDYDPSKKWIDGCSILPFFPGYTFDPFSKDEKSVYLGETIGEGGRVYSEPGMYSMVWDGDVTSMHPNSIIQENLFGSYTVNFADLVKARIYIKHKDFKSAGQLMNGKLAPFLTDEGAAKQLSQALKIAINSVYGLTSAKFNNAFRDNRNVDNIVAKRGALFMTKLKKEVEKRYFTVCHIKTDSIKIPNATDAIKEFVINFGHEYGYNFETEADFEKFCIVNDAVYVAKDIQGNWTATGTQFQVPYVFKTLFSHEDILFRDVCETKAVTKGELYLDMNENLPKDEHNYIYVGRVGLFCPILPGKGGGELFRINEGKPYAAPGTVGYRWLESEVVKSNNMQDDINLDYYNKMVDEARETISKYGDFDWFVSDRKPLELGLQVDDLPF